MQRYCWKYSTPFLTFWRALVLTKQLILKKEDWLLLCMYLNQCGSCTWPWILNCVALVHFAVQHEPNSSEHGFGRWPPLTRLFDTLSLYTSLKARDFSEQLLFSSLEIPDACWIFEAKIVKTIFSSSPWRENSPYPLPTWHVYKYNLLSLLAAIQIMGFILHPTQMAVTESGQEGRRSERKHMKLYWQDLKGKDR